MDNGPNYEPTDLDLPDKVVYCVLCGNIYVWTKGRKCPSCHVNEKLEEIKQELASD